MYYYPIARTIHTPLIPVFSDSILFLLDIYTFCYRTHDTISQCFMVHHTAYVSPGVIAPLDRTSRMVHARTRNMAEVHGKVISPVRCMGSDEDKHEHGAQIYVTKTENEIQ